MDTNRVPSRRRTAFLALLCAAAAVAPILAPVPAARCEVIASDAPDRDLSITVEPGDSWSAIRGRMFPTESLMSANPDLARKGLRPGDVVRTPFVPVDRVDSLMRRLSETQARLREATGARTALEERAGAMRSLERALADERKAAKGLRYTSLVLATAALVLGGALVGSLLFLRLSRREAHLAGSALAKAEARYTELRKELRGIDIDLQRRMVNLLRLHDVRIVGEEEVDRAMAPLVDLASEIKKKHAG